MARGVSVIIACFNSEKVIEKTLIHLQNQIKTKEIDWEVILVVNNCTDNTAEVAAAQWAANPVVKLNIIEEKKVGESNARRAGFRIAQYDVLSIVDDDNRVSEDWIFNIFTYFQNTEIGMVGCAGDGDFEENPPSWFYEHQNAFAIGKLYSGDFIDITSDAIVPGAGMSFRKSIIDFLNSIQWEPFLQGRVGNKQSAGADSELCYITRLLGYKIFYSNQLHFKHFTARHRISWERLENMTNGFGESDVFTLPYKILYEESIGKNLIINKLRKVWWFNYFGKKISFFLKNPSFKFDSNLQTSQKLHYIRNSAFCRNILLEKKRFTESFDYLKAIGKKQKSL